MFEYPLLFIFPLAMAYAAASDLLTLTIPNRVSLLLLGAFVALAPLAGFNWATFGQHLATGGIVLAVGIALFALRIFGGGDAKLLAAAALWFGWPDLVAFLVFTVFAGGALALTVGLWSLLNVGSEIKGGLIFRHLGSLKPNVPYGFALAAGAILALPDSWWVTFASQP